MGQVRFRLPQVGFTAREGGQSLIELALVLPVMVFGLLGGADLARAYAIQVAVQNGARAAAESYAIDSTPTTAEAQAAGVAEMNRTPSGTGTSAKVVVTEAQTDGITACIHPPTTANTCFATVHVTSTSRPVAAPTFVPNTANFDRTTIFQMFY